MLFPRVPDFNPPADGHKRFVFPDGKGVYDGHWRGCKRHGQGSFAFANGDVYEGERQVFFLGEETPSTDSGMAGSLVAWARGSSYVVKPVKTNVTFSCSLADIVTTGTWYQGEMTGEGKYTHASGEVYTGQVRSIEGHSKNDHHGAFVR